MRFNILIADDYDLNRNLIRLILEKKIQDISIFEAEDGNEVLDIIHNINIDLVILDLVMPGKNGFQVLEEMKSNNLYSSIPVIVNSSLDDMENVQKALEIGALDYFTKPLTNDDIAIKLPLKTINALEYHRQKKALIKMNSQMSEELRIANLFQSSLMSERKFMQSADMYGRYIPCGKLGGDFFDCEQIGGRIWFIIADVCGHGVTAAMLSSMIKIAFNNSISNLSTPEEVMTRINGLFCNILGDDNHFFFSNFIGVIKDGVLSYTNAGHYSPIIINHNAGSSELLPESSLLAGIDKNTVYKSRSVPVKKGDCIISYTDGLFENYPDTLDKGWESINDYCIKNSGIIASDPETFIDMIISQFAEPVSGTCKDDVTLMLVYIK